MRKGTFQWMKSVNKSIILNKIRTSAPISRAQIAKETNLTPPTVSSNVKELIDQGIVIESQLGESQGGRKPTMLQINNHEFYIIGVDSGPDAIECVLADLSGTICNRVTRDLIMPITNEVFVSILKECIHSCLAASSSNSKNIIGIGVAMHGVVDVETGTSLYAPNLGLTNISIKEQLENEFDLEVEVENDARAMALGESWFGDHGQIENMLVMNLGLGVGAGMIIDGELYHGAQHIAGEVGHMTIDLHGEVCECGNRGCLQTFTTGPAIAKRARELSNRQEISAEEVYALAVKGNREYTTLLEETATIIGIGLTNLIHVMNPQKIVLGGGVTKAEKVLLPVIRQTIEQRGLTPLAKKTEVVITKFGDDATLMGAIALHLVNLFGPTRVE